MAAYIFHNDRSAVFNQRAYNKPLELKAVISQYNSYEAKTKTI